MISMFWLAVFKDKKKRPIVLFAGHPEPVFIDLAYTVANWFLVYREGRIGWMLWHGSIDDIILVQIEYVLTSHAEVYLTAFKI
jgi:hypothetical protein